MSSEQRRHEAVEYSEILLNGGMQVDTLYITDEHTLREANLIDAHDRRGKEWERARKFMEVRHA